MKEFYSQIAPKDLIIQDLRILRGYERLDTTDKIQELLFMQSLEGRSHNGSGVFSKRPYVNTTIDDVVKALGLDPAGVKMERQRLIDDIVEFVKDTIHDTRRDRLVNANGEPFLGIPFFKDRKVNQRDILRGIYIGGLRDNADIRKETESRYGVRIGCGQCYIVDINVMAQMDLNGDLLAHDSHENLIDEYKKAGLIIESGTEDHVELSEDRRYYYIRHRIGPGQSDDAAIVITGILYNTDVALGVFLSDAIDTLEKYAPQAKDQDQELAYFIARGFRDIQMTMEDVYEIAYLSAIPEAQEEFIPDSSLRYLIAIDPRTNETALQNHLAYIEGREVNEIPISFKRILSSQFYEYIKQHLANARRVDSLMVPEVSLGQSDMPVGEIGRKNFIVVSKEETLSQVVRKFKESKSEIIIIVDKSNIITGTLSATDLIYLSRKA